MQSSSLTYKKGFFCQPGAENYQKKQHDDKRKASLYMRGAKTLLRTTQKSVTTK